MDVKHHEQDTSMLDTLIKVAPIFQKLFPLECSISIANREVFLVEFPSKEVNLNFKKGTPIPENSGIMKAVQTGEIQRVSLPKEIYGFPFKSVAVPIKDENSNVIGCIALGMSLRNQEMLEEAINTLSSTSQEIVASTEELAASAQELSSNMQLVDSLRREMEERFKKTEELLTFIKSVAQKSKILGINASIETARSGRSGAGFSIIASEIRKMAEDSASSVEKIEHIINEMKEKMIEISKKINQTYGFSENQAAASQQIAAAVQEVNNLIANLDALSKII